MYRRRLLRQRRCNACGFYFALRKGPLPKNDPQLAAHKPYCPGKPPGAKTGFEALLYLDVLALDANAIERITGIKVVQKQVSITEVVGKGNPDELVRLSKPAPDDTLPPTTKRQRTYVSDSEADSEGEMIPTARAPAKDIVAPPAIPRKPDIPRERISRPARRTIAQPHHKTSMLRPPFRERASGRQRTSQPHRKTSKLRQPTLARGSRSQRAAPPHRKTSMLHLQWKPRLQPVKNCGNNRAAVAVAAAASQLFWRRLRTRLRQYILSLNEGLKHYEKVRELRRMAKVRRLLAHHSVAPSTWDVAATSIFAVSSVTRVSLPGRY